MFIRPRRSIRKRRRQKVPFLSRKRVIVSSRSGRLAGPNQELKFFDTDTAANFDATGNRITSLNLVAQGTDENDRIGRKCTIKSVHWKGLITLAASPSASATASDHGRIILYLDKQTNGAAAAVTDLLESTATDAFRNLANSQRFVVLHDSRFTLTSAAAEDSLGFGPIKRVFNVNKRVNIPLEFSAGTGALTELRSNNLACLFISDGTDLLSFTGTFRIRFSDL